MARIYNQQQYGDQFQPRQQSRGFNPVIAIDASSKEKQTAAQAVQDIKTEMSSMQRQHGLDKGILDATQAMEKASAAHKAKVTQGILSLSQTALKGAQMVQQHQQEQQEIDETLDAMGFGGDDSTGPSQEDIDYSQDIDTQVSVEGQAIGEVSQGLQDGSVQGADMSNQLQQSSAYQALSGINGNILSARAAHAGFLQAAINELPDDMKPTTLPEAQALIRKLNGKFFQASGLVGADRKRVAAKLGGTVINNSGQMANALVQQSIKAQREANASALENNLWNAARSGASAAELWQMASEGAAIGNIGYSGRSAASNEKAMEMLLGAMEAQDDVMGITELRDTLKVPGNPGAGTLGDAYAKQFHEAIEGARQGKVQEWNRGKAERTMVAEQMITDYYNDPDSVDRGELIRNLRRLGPTGRAEAERIMGRGLNNDPELELEIAERAAAGNPYSEQQLQSFLDEGLIRSSVYTEQTKNSKDAQITKEVKSVVSGSTAQIKAGMQASLGATEKGLVSNAQKVEIVTRAGIFAKDLEQRLHSEAKSAGVLNNPMELEKLKGKLMNQMFSEPHYQLTSPTLGEVEWGAPINQETQYHQAITVSPGQQDIRKFTPEEIMSQQIIPRTELSHVDDNILTQADTLAAANVTDGNYGDRIDKLAKYMGISPKALVEGQLQRYNQPSLHNLQKSGELQNVQDVSDTTDFGKATGYAYIRNDLGFPARGAAYLTSAIDHESTWHGTREWGQVAGDGTNRNGGLISWASWSNNSARLGAIERHFGRSIANIPEKDQLEYMKLEMQRSYGDAYRVFMNPNASSADLQWAVSRYWGFDPKYTGSRWTDAERYIQNPPLQYTR